MHMTALARISATLAVALLCLAEPVSAQGFAVRGGANPNPIQLYGGVQYTFPPIWETLRPTPSVEAGLGHDAARLAVHLDALLQSRRLGRRSAWTVLLGGGPVINRYWRPLGSQTAVGINAVAALDHGSGWFGEFRLGFFDGPVFRVGLGHRLAGRTRSSGPQKP